MHHKHKNPIQNMETQFKEYRYFIHYFNQDIVHSSQNVTGILLHLTHI